jgi:outer membrane receptor protein involved in Fe transport
VNISFRVDEDRMFYASAAKGFRAGGANRTFFSPTCIPQLAALGLTAPPGSFGSDSLWNYEVGAKSHWFGSRLRVNASVYQIDWTDVQQSVTLPCGLSFTDNVGAASSQGVELETQFSPVEGLTIGVSASYVDAKLEEDAPSLGGHVGDPLVQVPEWSWAATFDYAFPAWESVEAFVHADYRSVDRVSTSFNFANPAQYRAGYEIFNLRGGLAWEGGLQIAAFVDNVANEHAELQLFFDAGPGARRVVTNRPRTIGLELSKDF